MVSNRKPDVHLLPDLKTDRLQRHQQQLAFVVMQFASEPWDLYEMIAEGLRLKHYFAIRATDVPERDDPRHIWALLRQCGLVLVDASNRNVNVYLELGAALAHATGSSRDTAPPVARIAERSVVEAPWRPFDLKGLKFVPYDVTGERGSTEKSVIDAVGRAVDHALDVRGFERVDPDDISIVLTERETLGRELLAALPPEAVEVLGDPGSSFLATRYVQFLGGKVELELAASSGFPELPSTWFKPITREFGRGLVDDPTSPAPDALKNVTLEAVNQLADIQRSRDAWVGQTPDVPKMTPVERRLTFVGALLVKPAERSSVEIEVLSATLGAIAERAHTLGASGLANWERGLQAVRQFTRMRAVSVAPTTVATIPRIQAQATKPWSLLQAHLLAEASSKDKTRISAQRDDAQNAAPSLIATLGGAYYLGLSIALLRDHASRYAEDALALAHSTLPGQQVSVPGGAGDPRVSNGWTEVAQADIDAYSEGLRVLKPMIAVEHPFHLRVLLEVLSAENRRYPAESVLNHEALRLVFDATFWSRFIWSRYQLPIVANLLTPISAGHPIRAFVQDYAAFGRTPHTSSFMRTDYPSEPSTIPVRDWWPEALADNGPLVVVNMPKSVAEGMVRLEYEQLLGRLWRGQGTREDIRRAAGELAAWDPSSCNEQASVRLLQAPQQWPRMLFPDLVITELRVARWLVDALQAWVAAPGEPVEVKEQVQAVLRIVVRFARGYLDGSSEDGVPGLLTSLSAMREPAPEAVGRLIEFVQAEAGGLSETIASAIPSVGVALRK